METLELLKRALKAAARVLRVAGGIQKDARHKLINDLHGICAKCEDAYGTVLIRLRTVKDAFSDPDALATELRDFAADSETRDAFKPEHLCGEVDFLLDALASNLDPLKYSIDVNRIKEIRGTLQNIGNVDLAIYASYDQLRGDLDLLVVPA